MPETTNHKLRYPSTSDPNAYVTAYKNLAEDTDRELDKIAPKQITGVAEKQLLIANASGVVTAVTASGDVTNDKAGVFLIGNEKVESKHVKDGTLADSDLASPNSAVYRTLLASGALLFEVSSGGVWLLGSHSGAGGTYGLASGQGFNVGVEPTTYKGWQDIFYFDDADYAVAGKTQKMRLRAQALVNGTKLLTTLTVGLFPVSVEGGGKEIKLKLGTVVTGSATAIASPAASTVTPVTSSDFTIPADGAYVLGVETSAKMTEGSAVQVFAQLQHHNV